MPMFIRSPWNYDRDLASLDSGLKCEDESLAKQEFKDETDINVILRRFAITGELPTGVRMPQYGDFTSVGSFHDAANAIAAARESFQLMPAHIRARFKNDPGLFVDWCENPANIDEARKLGLAPPAPTPDPQPLSTGEPWPSAPATGQQTASEPQPAALTKAP